MINSKIKNIFNTIYAASIVLNTVLFVISLFVFNNLNLAAINVGSGALCWIGYYRTKKDGNKSRN